MGHRNAPLTVEGRRRLCERVDAGRPICHVAAEAAIARQTLGKWYARWLAEGENGLRDRSSRPASSPHRTAVEVEDRVEALRREYKVGPVQLVGLLAAEGIAVPASTVYRILVRRGISRLRDLDVTGQNLNWFWNAWYFANGYIDLGISAVAPSGNGYSVTIDNVGAMPAPVDLEATFGDGTSAVFHQTSAIWAANLRRATVVIPSGKPLQSLVLNGGVWMDADSTNNRWTKPK